jgi:hypothetical protein
MRAPNSSKKITIYCYDWDTNQFLKKFDGVRSMTKELGYSKNSTTSIRAKLNKNIPFIKIINGKIYKKRIISEPFNK